MGRPTRRPSNCTRAVSWALDAVPNLIMPFLPLGMRWRFFLNSWGSSWGDHGHVLNSDTLKPSTPLLAFMVGLFDQTFDSLLDTLPVSFFGKDFDRQCVH